MKQFDAFDFCQWSLGGYYDFEKFVAPEGTIFMPDIDELLETTSRLEGKF